MLPGGLFDPNHPHYTTRAGTLIRYALDDKLGIDTGSGIENLTKIHEILEQVALKSFVQKDKVGALELLRLGFPQETEGEDPAIRIWTLDVPRKWIGPEGGDLVIRAAVWMLRFAEKMSLPDEHGSIQFNLPLMRAVIWNEVFRRQGLRSVIEDKNVIFRSNRDSLAATAARLGKPNLFGYSDDQLHPGKLRLRARWSGTSGAQEREAFADHLWKHVRSSHPDAFDAEGHPIPSRIKTINSW